MRLKTYSSQIVSALVLAFLLSICGSAQTSINAPGAPGKDAQWSSAGKQAIGTSASLESKIWFTLGQGVLTEVYYPDVTVANVHKLQFVVVNPQTKKVETEFDDAIHEIKVLRPDSLTFQQLNTAKSGQWKIIKTYATHPSGSSVWIRVQFESKSPELQLYAYYDPSLKNTGMHDSAAVLQSKNTSTYILTNRTSGKTTEKVVDEPTGDSLLSASEGDVTSLLLFNGATKESTSGFLGTSDGLSQLRETGELRDRYQTAKDGNVVQMTHIVNPKRFTVVLSFGKDFADAFKQVNPTEGDLNFESVLAKYEKGWSDYVKTLPKVDVKYQAQFNMAAMVLKAQEDKTVRGANVASLTIPWGGGKNANEDVGGGYHLVWARDLYQVFTAYLALGDTAAANRALDFLFNIQQKADGSFPQNSWLDGRNGWGGLQMDEVSYPLIMAYQLKRFDKATYENHVKKAADFLVKNGPKTPQERWEEKGGYSPSTIAAEIAGLVCAADIAKRNGDETSANLYLKTADDWQSNIEKWTATTNGKFGDGNYYVRLTANGKPDAGEQIELSNSSGKFAENEIVDAGFLELVRLGIKSPDDPLIVKSLKVIDAQIKINTPNGEAFYRYNHDGYGEQPDGRRWNFDGTYSGIGRLWALLSGERGQYELAQAVLFDEKLTNSVLQRSYHSKKPEKTTESQVLFKEAESRLDSMAKFANEGLMIPEQIWDKADTPKNIDKQFVPELKFGEGTGSATPLAWSMAQFIRLAVNLQAGKNLDTPDVVYNRYVKDKKGADSSQITDPLITQKDIDNLPVKNSNSLTSPSTKKDDCETAKSYLFDDSKILQTLPLRTEKYPTVFGGRGEKETSIRFAYFGLEKDVEIVGDFTAWKPCGIKFKDVNGLPNIHPLTLKFPNTARVEYKLIVDGKWINDPLNPNKVDNGVGGENSFFTMPDYQPTVWDKGDLPKLDEFDLNAKTYGPGKIKVYLPPNYSASTERFPVLYLEDGTEYFNKTRAAVQQENLVKAGQVKPFIIVLIDPKDRMKDYWANDVWADFVAGEVVPAVDAKYRTIKSRDGRALLGASLGGVTSVWTALKHPETFARVGGQSSSFWIDDGRVIKELGKLDAAKTPFKFYFDTGTLEGVENSRQVNVLLRGKGFPVVYEEAETGHNWTSWRDRLADAYLALWKN